MSETQPEQPQDGSESPAEAPVDESAPVVPAGQPSWLHEALSGLHERVKRLEGR